jgi:hypothetical protein
VIRIFVFAALLSLAAEAKRPTPPPAPAAPPTPGVAPAAPPAPDDDEDDDDDDRPRAPKARIPGHRSPGDDDWDEDQPEERDENGNKVRIYRLDASKMRLDKLKMKLDRRRRRYDNDDNGAEATSQARGSGTAALSVKGPITFRLNAQAGDVEVTTGENGRVMVLLSEAPADDIALRLYGERVEASFRGRNQLRRGKLHVELPHGSRVELTSMSGDITVRKLSGDVRIHTMSGDVKLAQVGKSEVQTISGDLRIEEALGAVRVHTVSGHAVVTSVNAAPQLEFQSASGSLDWSGLCAKDCHVSAETVSGAVRLAVDPRSSFELSYTSHSGELRDELNLTVKHSPKRKHGMPGGWLEATYGKGEGVIEADAFSGNLVVKKR